MNRNAAPFVEEPLPTDTTVTALLGLFTDAGGAHRATLEALLKAAIEQADLSDLDIPTSEQLADSLLRLRATRQAQLTRDGFVLTPRGVEAAEAPAVKVLRQRFLRLLGQKMQEWQIDQIVTA